MSKLINKNCIVFDIDAAEKKDVISAVSYTHLTLPTIA